MRSATKFQVQIWVPCPWQDSQCAELRSVSAQLTPQRVPLAERLDRLRELEESAYHDIDPNWRIDLRPPVDRNVLERIENQIDRRFTKDVIDLYCWHDGSDGATSFVPSIDFSPLHIALKTYEGVFHGGSFPVTNAPDWYELTDLFPVFNHERIQFSIGLNFDGMSETSPLYIVDFESGQLTEEARTLGDYIDHMIGLLERREYEVHGQELRWTGVPFRLEPDIEPYGPAHDASGSRKIDEAERCRRLGRRSQPCAPRPSRG